VTHGINDRLDGINAAEDNDGDAPIQVLHPPQEFDPTHARQAHIGNDQID
jgi:hypothetical protein